MTKANLKLKHFVKPQKKENLIKFIYLEKIKINP